MLEGCRCQSTLATGTKGVERVRNQWIKVGKEIRPEYLKKESL